LQTLKQAPSMATAIAVKDPGLGVLSLPAYHYMDEKALFFDLDEMMKTEMVQKYITYSLFMFLAMIAIFDTQALAVFKRRKEIGTLTALGMSQRQITTLFTMEGGLPPRKGPPPLSDRLRCRRPGCRRASPSCPEVKPAKALRCPSP